MNAKEKKTIQNPKSVSSWSCTQDIYGGQLSVAHRSSPGTATRVALRWRRVKSIGPHIAKPSHTSPRSIPTNPSRLGPIKKRNTSGSPFKPNLFRRKNTYTPHTWYIYISHLFFQNQVQTKKLVIQEYTSRVSSLGTCCIKIISARSDQISSAL